MKHKAYFAVIVLAVLTVTTGYSCPPLIERDCTVRGPGGSYGYVHISFNNQLWRRGQPQRYHKHILYLGPVSLDLTRYGALAGGIAIGALALFGVGWHHLSSRRSS